MTKIAPTFAIVCLALLTTLPVKAASYNAVTGFSQRANPNGPWSYTTSAGLLTVLQNYGNPKVNAWTNGGSNPNYAAVVRNSSGSTYDYGTEVISTDHLNMAPQSNSVTVRFTAPLKGTYLFRGNFVGQDTQGNPHPVTIIVNGTTVYSATISSLGQTLNFRENVSLNKRAIVDFVCGTGQNGYTYLSTGLKVLISSH